MKATKLSLKILSIVLVIIMGFASVVPAFADTTDKSDETEAAADSSQSVVVSYTSSSTKINKGDTVTIAVTIRNLELASDYDTTNIDITRTTDSFRYGTAAVVPVSQEKDNPIKTKDRLRYTVVFTGLVYSGSGKDLTFIVRYKDKDVAPETLTVSVGECVEYVESEKSAPKITINRGEVPSNLKAGQSFSVNINFTNTSTTTAYNASAVFEAGEGLTLDESKTSKNVGTLLPGVTRTVALKLKVGSEVQSSPQTLGVTLSYDYNTNSATAQGTATESILIPVSTAAKQSKVTGAATPNIIVSNYSYGGSSIAAGDKFNLSITFQNTSKDLAVENIIMAVQTDENLSITSSSNTFYFSTLKAGGSKTVTIEMLVPANISVTGASTDISFKYEYVNGDERTSSESSEKLTVPVYLPDRFSVSDPTCTEAYAYQEADISIEYINRGKGTVSNVEASVVIEDESLATCEQSTQNLGNFESGKSGTIDFFVTPNQGGDINLKFIIKYEDEMTEQKTIELPFTLTAQEMDIDPYPDDSGDTTDDTGETSNTKWIIVAVVAAVVVIAIVITIVIIKKKKKAKTEVPEDIDWNDDDEQV